MASLNFSFSGAKLVETTVSVMGEKLNRLAFFFFGLIILVPEQSSVTFNTFMSRRLILPSLCVCLQFVNNIR